MSAFIRIGKQTARRILSMMERWQSEAHPQWRADADELRRALAPSTKRTRARAAKQAQKTAKRQTKAEETSAIRTIVAQRAGGNCEACGGRMTPFDPPELDHQLGRGRYRQSTANTWLIHRSCHIQRTHNRPSAAHWLSLMLRHAEAFDHAETARILRGRLGGVVASRGAAAAEVMGVRHG